MLAKAGDQVRAVEGGQSGFLIHAEQNCGDIGMPDDFFRVRFEKVIIEIGQQGVGHHAAHRAHKAGDLRIVEQFVKFLRPLPDGAGPVKIPPAEQPALFDRMAALLQIPDRMFRRPGAVAVRGEEDEKIPMVSGMTVPPRISCEKTACLR